MRCWWRMWRERNRSSGFTLVETLVVLTIFAIIGVGIAGSLAAGMKIWFRAKSASASSLDVLSALETVSRDLRQAVNNIPAVGFEGKAQEISFLTFQGDTAVKVNYKFEATQKALIRREMDLKDALSEKLQGKYKEKQVASLDEFSFGYLYFDQDKEEYTWAPEWKKEQGVFPAVQLKAKLKDEAGTKTVFIPVS